MFCMSPLKISKNVLASIEGSKTRPFNRLLHALGILHVGERMAEILAQHFGSMDRLLAASNKLSAAVDDGAPAEAGAGSKLSAEDGAGAKKAAAKRPAAKKSAAKQTAAKQSAARKATAKRTG